MLVSVALATAAAVYFTKQNLDTATSKTLSASSNQTTTHIGAAQHVSQSFKIETVHTTAL